MNNDDQDFAARLQRLRPAAPAPALLARLKAIAEPANVAPRPRRISAWRLAVPLAAAAALVVAAFWLRPAPGPETDALAVETLARPAGALPWTDCLLGARELGIYHGPDGQPYRIVQGVGVGTERWRDPVDGSERTRTVPQQKLLLVSMASL